MRAQVLYRPKLVEEEPLEFIDVPLPQVGAGEVRIKVRCCGVCLTDKHVCEGELEQKKSCLIPGHQVVGRVDQLGKGVSRFQVGDRVGVTWLGKACGNCKFCLQGKENLCLEGEFTGWDKDGGYAEYVVADSDFVHPLPENIDDIHVAPLLCAGVIGYRSLKVCGAGKGAKLGLYGFGNSAHIAMQIAHHIGCETYAFARSSHHRELAKKLGAKWVGDTSETPSEKLDNAIVFAPAGEIVKKSLLDLDRGGKIAINAIHMSDIPSIAYDDLFYERTIQSVSNGTRADAEGLFSLLKECPIKTEVETYPLEEANKALLLQKKSQVKAACVLTVS